MGANLDQVQNTVPPSLALAPAEEVIWGWGKERERKEAGKGVLSHREREGDSSTPPISQL